MGFRGYAAMLAFIPIVVAGPSLGQSAAGPAQRWHTVSFAGVSLRVPSSWPVVNLTQHPGTCPRLNRHAVYLGRPGPDPACPAAAVGKTEAVQIQSVSPQSPDAREAAGPAVVGGQAARTNGDAAVTHTIVDLLPGAGIEVSLSYGGDLALARQIQGSIKVSPKAGPAPAQAPVIPQAAPRAAPRQHLYTGGGFDACTAPSTTTMSSWLASPYRAVGIYIGGVNRACAQASLTASWITAIQAMGWHYFPMYPGLQASCVNQPGVATISPTQAAAQGRASGRDAVAQARALGIPTGTPIIFDMEAYQNCGSEVIRFLNGWDRALHHHGYRAGVYESFSNVGDLIAAAGKMIEPDVISYARWDSQATTLSAYMPVTMWTGHHRIHQYRGGHHETWNGVTVNVDNDQLDVNLGYPVPAGLGQR
jgi:Domain of unknown function (DUF1906)